MYAPGCIFPASSIPTCFRPVLKVTCIGAIPLGLVSSSHILLPMTAIHLMLSLVFLDSSATLIPYCSLSALSLVLSWVL